MNNLNTQASELALVITRLFEAPRELVFKAWTEPESVAQWWGPRGFTSAVQELDIRPAARSSSKCARLMACVSFESVFQEIRRA